MQFDTPDLTDTAVYKRFGIAGLRWYLLLYFMFLYVALLGAAGTLLYLLHYLPSSRQFPIAISCVILAVGGSLFLTKLCIQFRAGVQRLETIRRDTRLNDPT